jgi:hypothetical protein
MKVTVGQALVTRKRADQHLDAILLDQLARRAHRAVGRRVGRTLDDLDCLAGDLASDFLDRRHRAAFAVLAEYREWSLEGREHADLDRVVGSERQRRRGQPGRKCQRKQCASMYSHVFLPLIDIFAVAHSIPVARGRNARTPGQDAV